MKISPYLIAGMVLFALPGCYAKQIKQMRLDIADLSAQVEQNHRDMHADAAVLEEAIKVLSERTVFTWDYIDKIMNPRIKKLEPGKK